MSLGKMLFILIAIGLTVRYHQAASQTISGVLGFTARSIGTFTHSKGA